MHHLDLIMTLTAGLAAALVCIVGYLLGGIAVGPYTPGLRKRQARVPA